MVGTIIVCILLSYIMGVLVGKDGDSYEFQAGFVTFIICMIVLFIHYQFNEDFHPLWGLNKPKFYLKEHALMKDGTVGRIDGIYYEIEGKLINQDSLK